MQDIQDERANTLSKFTGVNDVEQIPLTRSIIDWEHFNVDLWSTERQFSEVADICSRFSHKMIDLRPYMIEEPHCIHVTDKLPKVLDMFRHFHLRVLPVLDPNDGNPIGLITRADLFSYMTL